MVSKAKSIKGSAASIEYIQNDKELGNAVELARNGVVSNEPNEIMKEFRLMQSANVRCEKNTISIVISPSDERTFTNSELSKIGKEHLKRLGLEDHQYLMTRHGSTKHPHIHIIVNRIDDKGVAFNDSFISKKVQTISENIAKEIGLSTAKDIQKINEIRLSPIKNEIKTAHEFAKNNSRNFDQYKDFMHGKGITVKPTINKKGEMQGFRLLHRESGLNFKSSEIGKNFGIKNLIESGVKMPSLTPPLQQIALKIAKLIVKQASRGIGF